MPVSRGGGGSVPLLRCSALRQQRLGSVRTPAGIALALLHCIGRGVHMRVCAHMSTRVHMPVHTPVHVGTQTSSVVCRILVHSWPGEDGLPRVHDEA